MDTLPKRRNRGEYPILHCGFPTEEMMLELFRKFERERKCWLIERGDGRWWTGAAWSKDADMAIRFVRRIDADTVIVNRPFWSPVWQDCDPFSSEHIFLEVPDER